MTTLLDRIRQRHKLKPDQKVGVKSRDVTLAWDDEDDHKFTAVITSNAVDRDDEVLLPEGMTAAEFERSGAIFWNHNYDQPVAIPGRMVPRDRMIEAKGTFLKRPADYQGDFYPDFVRSFVNQMATAGRGAGVSVGFIPLKARNPSSKDRERFGDGVKRVISRWQLLEWSIAPVQANPEAMVTMVGKGILDRKVVKAVLPDIELPEPKRKRVVHVIVPGWRKDLAPIAKREVLRMQGRFY